HGPRQVTLTASSPVDTPLQYGILETIHDSEVLAQKHVAARLGSPPQSLVPLVRDLEDRGLVERVRSEVDRRRHLLTLTEAGLDLLVEIRDRVTGVEAGLTGGLAAGEREQLLDLLCRLRRGTPV
ncbi:MAG: MarR family transcriptional regulator, partial [bacterium]|nr:MarR family transcriptional regulator [bacterium]